MTRALARGRRDERASIPLALLAIIAIGGVISALCATTIAGQRDARRDRDFTSVIQGADEGVQAAYNTIARTLATAPSPPPVGATEGPHSGQTADGSAYTWSAVRTSAMRWDVTAAGTRNGEARTVTAVVQDTALFDVALVAVSSATLDGSTADAYDGAGYCAGAGCRGVVTSNGPIALSGGSAAYDAFDGFRLANWAVNPGPHRCTGGGRCADALADPPLAPSRVEDPPMAIGDGLPTLFIDQQLEQCRAADGGTLPSVTYPEQGGVVMGPPYSAEVRCAQDLTIDADTTVAEHITFYVAGSVTITRDLVDGVRTVNCAEGCGAGDRPTAGSLRIYSVGTRVEIGDGTNVAAGIYAPHAQCLSDPGDGEAQVFGALVCDEVVNGTGWHYHYDARLADVGTGRFRLESWQEQ